MDIGSKTSLFGVHQPERVRSLHDIEILKITEVATPTKTSTN